MTTEGRRPAGRRANWDIPSLVRDEMRDEHKVIADLADRSVLLIEAGVSIGVHQQMLAPWQEVLALAAGQVHNSLGCGWELAFAGFGVQAIALARLALEYEHLAKYIPDHRSEAQKWLDAKEKPPKSAGQLADAIYSADPETDAGVRNFHNSLHRFAHLDPIGFGAIAARDGTKGQMVLGPRGDSGHVVSAAYMLLVIGAVTLEPLELLVVGRNPAWTEDVGKFRQDLDRWIDEVDPQLVAAGQAIEAAEAAQAAAQSGADGPR